MRGVVLVAPAKQALKPLSLAAANQGDPGVRREAGQRGCKRREAGQRGSSSLMPSQLGANPQGWLDGGGEDGIVQAAVPPISATWYCFLGVCVTSASSHHTLPAPAAITPEILGPCWGFSLPPCRPSPTLAAVVVGVGAPGRGREWIGGRAGAQGCDHLHDIGHDHLAGTHGLESLGRDAVRVILNVEVRLDGHWPPAACGVNGDLFKLGAGGSKGAELRL